jgi:hypothetical protein
MTWAVVARKDFNDARRSRSLWGLSAAFLVLALLFAGLYAFVPEFTADEEVSTLGLMTFLSAPVALFVAVASLVVAYKSIAGEAETGSGKLLLSLPHTRRDIVLGKVVGRSLVLAIPVLVGLVAMLAVVFVGEVAFSVTDYVLFGLVTMLFVLVYMAFYVGISASTTSTARAATLSVLALVRRQRLRGPAGPVQRCCHAGLGRVPREHATQLGLHECRRRCPHWLDGWERSVVPLAVVQPCRPRYLGPRPHRLGLPALQSRRPLITPFSSRSYPSLCPVHVYAN